MVKKRIRIGADSFRVHGLFDETGLFLLMEEGDILSDEDFMQMENFVEHNSDGDIFLLPKKYGPSKRSKKGIMTAPFSCCNADVLEGEKERCCFYFAIEKQSDYRGNSAISSWIFTVWNDIPGQAFESAGGIRRRHRQHAGRNFNQRLVFGVGMAVYGSG